MSAQKPIDPRVRLAIAQWPDDAPRGAVSTFCAEHGISRKSFYELRKTATLSEQPKDQVGFPSLAMSPRYEGKPNE